MTRDEINEITSCREVDVLIAEAIGIKPELKLCRLDVDEGWREYEDIFLIDPEPDYYNATTLAELKARAEAGEPKIGTALEYCYKDTEGSWHILPYYSEELSWAWDALMHFREKYRIYLTAVSKIQFQCRMEIRDGLLRYPMEQEHIGDRHADDIDVALAICKAILMVAYLEEENG